jgi:hypothetical protein
MDENFLEGYLRYNRGTEIPPMFALWCGVAGISAVLGRNSYTRLGPFKIYPNVFVILVASSGKCRKSSSIEMIDELLHLLDPGPNMIAQKLSPEALIQSVRQVETKDPTRLLAETCTGFVIADELSTFLNKKSYEAGLASLLIQLYDCKSNFQYRTVIRQVEQINNACLGMLAGSTIDWIRSGVPEESVGGGLTSRMLFVYVDQPSAGVAVPEYSEEHLELKMQLVKQLQQISTLTGEFKMDPAALTFFKEEYNSFRNTTGTAFYNDKTLEGYASRRANHLLKIAMAFSASDSLDMVIKKHHMSGARELLSQNERNLQMVMNLITSSNRGVETTSVLSIIKKYQQIKRGDLMKIVSHRMTARELDEALTALILGGQIVSEQRAQGVVYAPAN